MRIHSKAEVEMVEDLNVEVREETGSRKVKQLRAAGKIPAVIYGGGEDTISLSLPTDAFNKIISRGERIISLTGGVKSDAFIKDVQWDVFGANVLHVDLTRVAAGTLINTSVKLEWRGVAPGTKVGGELATAMSTLEIRCPPKSMTDKIDVSINELELGQRITIGDLQLPEGAEAVLDANTVLIQCVDKSGKPEPDEEAPVAPSTGEPEVIGAKKDEDSGD